MPTLLQNISVTALQKILANGDPAAPLKHLTDPATVRSARRLAKKNAIWQELSRDFDPHKSIVMLKRSLYRAYQRVGVRADADTFLQNRRVQMLEAALALWLDHPRADLDALQDLLWAMCDDFTWVMPSHEWSPVDLAATGAGAALVEVLAALGDRLEPEVVERVRGQIEARVLAIRDHPHNWWRTIHHNWNHVCNGNIIRIALALWHDQPKKLAAIIHQSAVDMQHALDGFADDGGCLEGPGYWNYGFGHFVDAAHALHAYTRGRINLMSGDPKIERICRYPLASHIADNRHAPFADTMQVWLPARIALLINRFFTIPELFSLCQTHAGGSLVLSDWNELGLYRGEKAPKMPSRDALLPALGMARIRSAPGKRQLTVAAAAGNNGVNHNHNDIGTFVAYRDGVEWLTDPGAPIYNSKTFSDQRYDILFCNSLGHSVPLVNGRQQSFGKEFSGTISVDGFDVRGDKAIELDLTRAYPAGTVESLQRRLALDYAGHTLSISDAYRFKSAPKAIVETFITYQPARVINRGRAVRLGKGRAGATLVAGQPGRFKVVAETEASKEGRTGQVVKRVLFTPATLAKEMTLQFELR